MQNLAQDMKQTKIDLQKLAQVMYFLQFIASFEKIKSYNLQNLVAILQNLAQDMNKNFNLQNHGQYCINLRKLYNLLKFLKKNLVTSKILCIIAKSCERYEKKLTCKIIHNIA